MKKFSVLIALMLLAVAIFPVAAQTPSTITQAPGTWTSSINIQNVDTGRADVVLRFFDASGNEAYADTTSIVGEANGIPAGGSRTIVLSGLSGLLPGQYSVVVESSMKLEVIANSTSSGPVTAGAYQGVKDTELSKTLYFPGLYKSYYNFSSEIVLQNTEDTEANIDIDFYDPNTGNIYNAAHIDATIPGRSTRIFALTKYPNVPSGNTNGILSAKVVSDKFIAGVANTWTPYMRGEFSDYNGFAPTTATTVYAPGLYNYFYGFVSSLTVQNVGTLPTDIKITFSDGTELTATLAANQAFPYFTGVATLPSGNTDGIFSAKIESLPNGSNPAQPIVALVNVESKTKGMLGSYNAPSAGNTKIGCPVLMKNLYGWYTGTTVQNVGASSTDIKITYSNGMSKTFNDVASNGTVAITEIGALPDGSPLPDTTVVSGTIESLDGQPLVAVVQEDSHRYPNNPGDYLLVYTCVVQP